MNDLHIVQETKRRCKHQVMVWMYVKVTFETQGIYLRNLFFMTLQIKGRVGAKMRQWYSPTRHYKSCSTLMVLSQTQDPI